MDSRLFFMTTLDFDSVHFLNNNKNKIPGSCKKKSLNSRRVTRIINKKKMRCSPNLFSILSILTQSNGQAYYNNTNNH